ncbi:MAG: glutathione S-transferase [Alphaproteobacteria bacterium]|nr:glutathione S-transferase [Alphaproteobacteria bacterium]
MTLTFWTNPMSRGQIVHWMMEELGEPYETVWLDWGPGGNKSADFLKINPMGKVPAVRHDGRIVTECAAICLYLADMFPNAKLKPAASALADYYRWTLFAAGPLEHAVTSKTMGWSAPAEREMTLGFGSFDATVDALEGMLKDRNYVCGEVFTAADVYVGSAVAWGLQFGTMPKRPAFEAYAARLEARPAYARTKEICNARIAEANAR